MNPRMQELCILLGQSRLGEVRNDAMCVWIGRPHVNKRDTADEAHSPAVD
jgi:hypothetical protein